MKIASGYLLSGLRAIKPFLIPRNSSFYNLIGAAKLTAEDNRLVFYANNLEHEARITKPVIEGGDFEIAIDAVMLERYAATLTGTLELSVDNGALVVQHEKGNARFRQVYDYDIGTSIREVENWIVIDANEFKRALNACIYATSTDVSRPLLTCVKIAVGDGIMRLRATDGFRAAYIDLAGVSGEFDAQIPGKSLAAIFNNIESGEVLFGKTKQDAVVFRNYNNEFSAVQVNGTYPDIDSFIPKHYESEIDIDVDELLEVVRRLAVIEPVMIKVHGKEDGLTLIANSDNTYLDEFYRTPASETLRFALSPKFFVDALKVMKSAGDSKAKMRYVNVKAPVTFVSRHIHMIMPMAMDE